MRRVFSIAVKGTSMLPSFSPEERVLAVSASAQEVECGDVVLCLSERGTYLLHRAVRIARVDGQPQIYTRGDGMTYEDGPFPPERIVAKVAFSLGSRASRQT